jgi:hypothetical protein
MVVEILSQKYKCGCNRGINKFDQSNILRDLNLIMEWDLCIFPKKLRDDWDPEAKDAEGNPLKPTEKDYVEDRDFLGKFNEEGPELKPGDCFFYDGQVIAVDSPSRLVLIVSETGPHSLERIYREHIEPEIELMFDVEADDLEVVWEDLADDPDEQDSLGFDKELRLPSYVYGVWRERFLSGREDEFKKSSSTGNINISCTVSTIDLPIATHIVLQNYSVLYKSSEFDEEDYETLVELVKNLLSWFCNNFTRKTNPIELENKKREEMNKVELSIKQLD